MPQVVICILFALLGLSDKFFGHQSLLFSLSSPIKVHSETHLGHFGGEFSLLTPIHILLLSKAFLHCKTARSRENRIVDIAFLGLDGLHESWISLSKWWNGSCLNSVGKVSSIKVGGNEAICQLFILNFFILLNILDIVRVKLHCTLGVHLAEEWVEFLPILRIIMLGNSYCAVVFYRDLAWLQLKFITSMVELLDRTHKSTWCLLHIFIRTWACVHYARVAWHGVLWLLLGLTFLLVHKEVDCRCLHAAVVAFCEGILLKFTLLCFLFKVRQMIWGYSQDTLASALPKDSTQLVWYLTTSFRLIETIVVRAMYQFRFWLKAVLKKLSIYMRSDGLLPNNLWAIVSNLLSSRRDQGWLRRGSHRRQWSIVQIVVGPSDSHVWDWVLARRRPWRSIVQLLRDKVNRSLTKIELTDFHRKAYIFTSFNSLKTDHQNCLYHKLGNLLLINRGCWSNFCPLWPSSIPYRLLVTTISI